MSDDTLERLYAAWGYPSKTKFQFITRALRKKKELNKTIKEVNDFLDRSAISVLDAPVVGVPSHYNYPSYDFALIIDLMDMSIVKSKNEGYNWILNILEHHSRFVFSFKLKSKSSLRLDADDSNKIASALESVLEQIDPGHTANILVVSDQGTEFRGEVTKMLKKYENVYRRYSDAQRKSTMPVERFNKTLRVSLARAQAATGSLNWTSHLDTIVGVYNGTPHSGSLDDTAPTDIPVDRLLSVVEDLKNGISHAVINLDGLPERKYPNGTRVRVQEQSKLFDKKSSTAKLSSVIYTVKGFEHTFYIVEDDEGNQLEVIEERLRPTSATETATVNLKLSKSPRGIREQLSDEQQHNRTQRRLADILPKKSLDTHVVVGEDGRESVQMKPSRMPRSSTRDKSAAKARISEQLKGN